MARKHRPGKIIDPTLQVQQDLLIVQLGLAGVPKRAIRDIVGCEWERVDRILDHLKKDKSGGTRKRR